MTREEMLIQLDELLEMPAGTLKGDEKLEQMESWNSLAMVSFIGLVDEHFGKRPAVREFANCQTVGDLLKLAGLSG